MAIATQQTATSTSMEKNEKQKLYKTAALLAGITIGYNLIEGFVSVGFGLEDETLALFGFGVDSFVEVISGIGILHMVLRLQQNGAASPDVFEQRALRITGTGLYVLALGLLVTAVIAFWTGSKPETTVAGAVIGLVSIVTMWLLIRAKMSVGRALQSSAIIADAACTKTCLYLSIALLAASMGYELTGIGALDALGALAIAVFAFREGREAFQKAKGIACCSSGSCS